MKIDKCKKCGKVWDDDGCRVSGYEAMKGNFVCEMCQDMKKEEGNQCKK